jgi:hypothetical protein
MPINDPPPLSDRQARAVIIAAERLGFEREPDLHAPWYDHALHEDASEAAAYLRSRDPDGLREALVAEEPIPADSAADRITESGRFTCADADLVIRAAMECGFTPPTTDLPLLPSMLTWDRARASVAFLWEQHPSHLAEVLGELARLAPLPSSGAFRSEMPRATSRRNT